MLRLVYLRSGPVVLIKAPPSDWREIQQAFPDFMTDLGPWSEEELVDFFVQDFGPDESRWPFTAAEVAEFVRSGQRVIQSRD